MHKRVQTMLNNPQLRQAMREALGAQLALWDSIGEIETHADLPGDGTISESLEEFAIGIDRPEDITDAVLNRAIAWICFGEEIA